MSDYFSTGVLINASPAKIWETLSNPAIMSQWMGDPEMQIEIQTDWQVNAHISIRAFHQVPTEIRASVLHYEKNKKLSYTHLSSASHLPDLPENHTILEFMLEPIGRQTNLTLGISNFPTETIRRHLEFYWRTTLTILKNKLEAGVLKMY